LSDIVHPPAATDELDARFMRHALALSRRGLGRTWPNPSVGALLVRAMDGEPIIVGRGATRPGGRPHGEAEAIAQAGEAAAGATLYVALEPCAYRSVRGGVPCVERTLQAGIRRVVSAIADPNPRIAGLGHALLRSAGVRVDVGLMEAEAARIHRGHFKRVREGLPSVTLKIARTEDNFAGGPGRTRIAISCPAAGDWVHLARARHDAIMLGVQSVLADDPLLTVRLPGMERRSPVRVVLDTNLRSHAGLKLAAGAREVPTWIIAAEDAPVANERALTSAGVEVMRVERGGDGHLDLRAALALLATRGVTRVFSEGGPTLGEELARRGLVDEVVISTSTLRLGAEGVVAVRPGLAAMLRDETRFRHVGSQAIGRDIFDFHERMI
jgi:diaminohydroxyphosphoribosylaminopyrimidine deaminase/5-amino-6-(5-phosphoribosylamino)uracil reductase